MLKKLDEELCTSHVNLNAYNTHNGIKDEVGMFNELPAVLKIIVYVKHFSILHIPG